MTGRMAAMQPYLFPYLGYWQLINAVDTFILFDDVKYIKQGWINRNRILKHSSSGWQYIQIPIAKHPLNTRIRDVKVSPDHDWQSSLLRKLAYYKLVAPYFAETMELVRACIEVGDEDRISLINYRVVRLVCEALSIGNEIILSSEYGFDYSDVLETSDWTIAHALQLGAAEILNPVNGISLQSVGKLASHGIRLSALHPPEAVYEQGGTPFEANLSIIDVMMFNGLAETRRLIQTPIISPCETPDQGGAGSINSGKMAVT